MNHLSNEHLQRYADGICNGEDIPMIETHLQLCTECGRKLKLLRRTDEVLRSLPLEQPSADFTQSVMKALRIQEAPSLLWIFLKNFAPVVALTVVIGATFMILSYTGVFQGSQNSITNAEGLYRQAEKSLSGGIQTFNSWLGTYVSFAFAKNSIGLTGFLLVFFAGIALFDKFVLMPMLRKRG